MSKIRTISGRMIDVLNFKPEDINAYDIAWAMNGINRYLSHTPVYYSDLAHTGLVYLLADKTRSLTITQSLTILLHDAHEVYTMDFPRPIKHLSLFDEWNAIADKIAEIIYYRFNVYPDNEILDVYDKVQAPYVEGKFFGRPVVEPVVPYAYIPAKLPKGDVNFYIAKLKQLAIQNSVENIDDLFEMPAILEPYLTVGDDVVQNVVSAHVAEPNYGSTGIVSGAPSIEDAIKALPRSG